jgi:hypothetical protein
MSHQPSKEEGMQLSARQFAGFVAALCLGGAIVPMVVSAATSGPAAKRKPPTRVVEVDPKTKAAAKIGPGGTRLVGDGSGPLTVDGHVTAAVTGAVTASDGSGPLTVDGTVKVANGTGPLTVDGTVKVANGTGPLSIDGTVRSQPVAPATPWNQINDIQVSSSTSRAVLYSTLGPQKLALTSFTFAVEGPNAGTARAFVIVYVSDSSAGNCLTLTGASFGAAERFVVTAPVGQTVNVTYPTPLVYSVYAGSGKRYCVDVEGTGPASFVGHVSASGFTY